MRDYGLLILGTVAVVLAMTAWAFAHEAHSLQAQLDARNAVVAQAVIADDKNYKNTVETIEKIKTVYKTEYVAIQTFTKDNNETECNASVRLINSTTF
jgi:hypothetical protein